MCNCYKLNPCLRDLNIDFTLNNCLFWYVKLIKNAGPDKYKYSCYDIEFYSRWKHDKNVTTFEADMSSSVQNKDILILGEGPSQGLDDTTLTA